MADEFTQWVSGLELQVQHQEEWKHWSTMCLILTTEQPEELHSERDSEPQVKEVLDH